MSEPSSFRDSVPPRSANKPLSVTRQGRARQTLDMSSYIDIQDILRFGSSSEESYEHAREQQVTAGHKSLVLVLRACVPM